MSKVRQETLQLTAGNHKGDRRELDYYPTPPEATIALMDFLKLPRDCIVWEPASGDGAMSRVIERYVDRVISSDIRSDCYGESDCDFLRCSHPEAGAIITNPPFNLSEQFIRKALAGSGLVAMLLKSQYWHAKKRFELFEQHPPAWVLPLTWRPNFLAHERKNGETGSPTMEVAWTVWIKGDTTTKYYPLRKLEFKPWQQRLI